MTAKILTDRMVRDTRVPEDAREVVLRDLRHPGLHVRVRRSGSILWCLDYRIHGRRRVLSLGTGLSVDAARALASAADAQIKAGTDPADVRAERRREADARRRTLKDAVADYLRQREADRNLRPASLAGLKADLARVLDLLDPGTPVPDIDGATFDRAMRAAAERWQPTGQRRVFFALRSVLQAERRAGHIKNDPADLHDAPGASPARTRLLTDDELRILWHACADRGPNGAALRFGMALPLRRSLLTGLQWAWIDESERLIRIPGTALGNKAGRPAVLPYGELAAGILAGVNRIGPSVFTYDYRGARPATMDSGWMRDLRTASGVHDWTVHDLRRTFRSILGARLPVVDADAAESLLMHTSARAGVVGVYDQSVRIGAMRHLIGQWDDILTGIIINRKDNVVPLRA